MCVCLRAQTNNPRKMNTLTKLGINVTGRIPCLVAAGEFNQVRAFENEDVVTIWWSGPMACLAHIMTYLGRGGTSHACWRLKCIWRGWWAG